MISTLRKELKNGPEIMPGPMRTPMSIDHANSIRDFRKIIQKQIDMEDDEEILFDHLEQHREKYADARLRIYHEISHPGSMLEMIEEDMELRPIKCQKYNYTLDDAIQNYTQFSSLLSISDDGSMIILTNIRPNENYNNPEYI